MGWEPRGFEGPMEGLELTQRLQHSDSPFLHTLNGRQSNTNNYGASITEPVASRPSSLGLSFSTARNARANDQAAATTSRLQSTASLRNPSTTGSTFTTLRKSHEDPLSDESSPAASDVSVSDYVNTPEMDSPAKLTPPGNTSSRSKTSQSPRRWDENTPRSLFRRRGKVRKRKRLDGDKDVSGYRLPYFQNGDYGDGDATESDNSIFPPYQTRPEARQPKEKGPLASFLSLISRYPHAPKILKDWIHLFLQFLIALVPVLMGWAICKSYMADYGATKQEHRAGVVDEIAKCTQQFVDNRCAPREGRLPALLQQCDEWDMCMSQNPDNHRKMQLGALSLVDFLNDVTGRLHWKTMAFLWVAGLVALCSTYLLRNLPSPPPALHDLDRRFYMHPQTPHRLPGGHLRDIETPEATPSPLKILPGPYGRSPSKRQGDRSPVKSRN